MVIVMSRGPIKKLSVATAAEMTPASLRLLHQEESYNGFSSLFLLLFCKGVGMMV
jgi:hypothetical protein